MIVPTVSIDNNLPGGWCAQVCVHAGCDQGCAEWRWREASAEFAIGTAMWIIFFLKKTHDVSFRPLEILASYVAYPSLISSCAHTGLFKRCWIK